MGKYTTFASAPSASRMVTSSTRTSPPPKLRQWHERNFGGGDVRVLEVTMRDADGADANVVYFPMG